MLSSAAANPLALCIARKKRSDDRPPCLENPRPGGADLHEGESSLPQRPGETGVGPHPIERPPDQGSGDGRRQTHERAGQRDQRQPLLPFVRVNLGKELRAIRFCLAGPFCWAVTPAMDQLSWKQVESRIYLSVHDATNPEINVVEILAVEVGAAEIDLSEFPEQSPI